MTETEEVLNIKLCGVPEDIEQRVVGGEEHENLALAIEDIADGLDIPYEMLSVGVTEEPKRRPPTRDSDPVEPLSGWEGGEVEHTGGGIFCRIFRHPEKHVEIIYNPDDLQQGVGLYALIHDEEWGYFNNGNELDQIGVDSAQEAIDSCKELMQQVNDGAFDDELTEIQAPYEPSEQNNGF